MVNDALPLPLGTEPSWTPGLAVPRLFRVVNSYQKPIGCRVPSR